MIVIILWRLIFRIGLYVLVFLNYLEVLIINRNFLHVHSGAFPKSRTFDLNKYKEQTYVRERTVGQTLCLPSNKNRNQTYVRERVGAGPCACP